MFTTKSLALLFLCPAISFIKEKKEKRKKEVVLDLTSWLLWNQWRNKAAQKPA
jgi:hypothetical protein